MTVETPAHELLCEAIVSGTPDAIIYADREGIIRLWNAGAEALFGYGAGEALGKSLDMIIPDQLRARHWEGYGKVMATGETRYGKDLLAVPGVRKDGTRVSLEFSILMLVDPVGGKPIGTAAILRDVTARWKKDKEQKDRIAVLEAAAKKA
jgi:PAS domain S-box-containing protein